MRFDESNSLKIKEWCRSQPQYINEHIDPKVLANDLNISLEECCTYLDVISSNGYAVKYIEIECPNADCRQPNCIDSELVNEKLECSECNFVFIPKNYMDIGSGLLGIYYGIDEEYYLEKKSMGFNPYNHININHNDGVNNVIQLIDDNRGEEKNMNKKDKKIFISHCSSNKDISELVFQLIKDIKVSYRKIYYSSSEETGAKLLNDCLESIEKEFNQYELLVLFIVSKEFYDSKVCLAETGATWVTCKQNYIPIILPPYDYEDLGGVIKNTQNSIYLGDKNLDDRLDTFKKSIEEFFELEDKIQDTEWKRKKQTFIENIKEYIDSIENIESKINDFEFNDKDVVFNISIKNSTKQRRKIGKLNITIVKKDGTEIETEIDREIISCIVLKPLSSINICLPTTIENAIEKWEVQNDNCKIKIIDYIQE